MIVSGFFQYVIVILLYVLTEVRYVKLKKKKCSFENSLVEKSESSTRNNNGLVEGLYFTLVFM